MTDAGFAITDLALGKARIHEPDRCRTGAGSMRAGITFGTSLTELSVSTAA
jgi:hypothetical protein